MILCIDIGNTNIVYDFWDNNQFTDIKRLETGKHDLLIADKKKITQIAISSVVPELTDYYKKYFRKTLNIDPFIVNYENCGNILDVDSPAEVGADRICNIFGAKEKYGYPCMVIDFGSATTYDILDDDGQFIGGAIAPGIDVSANYLIKKAALLNKVTFQFPEKVIGKNTKTNLQSGIMYGGLDSVEGMIKRIISETNLKHMKIILTGGFCPLISDKMVIPH